MKKFSIHLVTEHQHKIEKAEKLGELISKSLNLELKAVRRYSKFDGAYRISLEGVIPDEENFFEYGIKITSAVVNGWTVNYTPENNSVEFIFNKTPYSRYAKVAYNVILWGQFTVK